MATLLNFKINGKDVKGVRELEDTQVSIDFGNDNPQANINLSKLSFVNEANKELNDWANGQFGVIEGTPFEMSVSNGTINGATFEGYIDHATRVITSQVESEASVIKTNGLNGFHVRSQGITMYSLENSGIMPTSLGVNIPYRVKNRKTDLEKIQIAHTIFTSIKMGYDEIFKLVNISSDITSLLGTVQAGVNLGLTIINLGLIIARLVDLMKQIDASFFKKVSYHRGIKLITFLEKGCAKMGYTLDTGTFQTELNKITLCPHKTDEVGNPTGLMSNTYLQTYQNNQSGILKPNDFGYVLSDAFELTNRLFYSKVAVIGNVVKLLPYTDGFWIDSPSYTMPDMDFDGTANGIIGTNLIDLKSRTLIEYLDDDSDKWTISNVNNAVSETIVEPLSVNNEKNVILKGIDHVEIPYALCIRNEGNDSLVDLFKSLSNLISSAIQKIRDVFDTVEQILGVTIDVFENYTPPTFNFGGAMKVENDFFSRPKIVYLENGKIPSDFNTKIGAPALYNNYHSYKSFVPGVKNPNNLNDTNQRKTYKGVNIPFGIDNFNEIITNSYFNTPSGGVGKFTNVLWNVNKDNAIVDFYIPYNYLTNIKETTI